MLVPLELERPSGWTPPSTPFSPVSSVPPELLTKIFLYVVSHQEVDVSSSTIAQDRTRAIGLGTTRTAPHTPSHRSCAGPFSISHVCPTWRGLSLSIPALWTNLQVISPRTTKLVRLLSLWIGRTRQRPLSLSLYQYPCSPSPRTEQATKYVWRLFLSAMDRWRSLDVNVSMGFDRLMYGVCRAKWSAPLNLETIKISFGSLNETPPAPRRGHRGYYPGKCTSEELTFFACALHCSPRLHTAEWDNSHFYLQFGLISQLWGTLTDLTLTVSQDMVGLVFALSRCRSLQKLTIHNQTHVAHSDVNTSGNHHDNTLFPPLTPSQCSPSYIDLPNLHTLTLGTFMHPELLFCHLFVPGIRTLLVLHGRYNKKGWRGLSNAAWASLQEMCRRCGASLAVLAVGGVEVDAAFDEPQWKGLARCTLKVADYHYSPLQKV